MKNERTRMLVALLCGAGAPLACSGGGAVNIGNTEAIGAQLSDYAASWDGYAQAYTFSPDGSDRVRLTIDPGGQGTLEVGDAALLAPPTDPSVGYPPSNETNNPFDEDGTAAKTLEEGFLYPLHAAQVQSDRIQLGVDPVDIYTAWCALQTPVAQTNGNDGGPLSYGCVSNYGFTMSTTGCGLSQADGTIVPADCGKVALCQLNSVCACTATSCSSALVPAGTPVGQYPFELDGALDATGSTLTGTLLLANATRVTVVLQKQ